MPVFANILKKEAIGEWLGVLGIDLGIGLGNEVLSVPSHDD
jgi:hypothetical protein